MEINEITEEVIGGAIEVHRTLGPGLLENAYEECLCRELSLRKIPFQRQYPLPLKYKEVQLNCGYRVDLVIAGSIIVEIKAVERVLAVHEAQIISYLKLGGWKVGLLLNFNVSVLRSGIRRFVSDFDES